MARKWFPRITLPAIPVLSGLLALSFASHALTNYQLFTLSRRVTKLVDAADTRDTVAFPTKLVFRKSPLYAPCIEVGTAEERSILWKERTIVLSRALNQPAVQKVMVEMGCPSDLIFRYEQHHPTTLEVIGMNEIWWSDRVPTMINVLNQPRLQEALQRELAGVRILFPKLPDPGV